MRPLRRAHERLGSEAKTDAWSESHAHLRAAPAADQQIIDWGCHESSLAVFKSVARRLWDRESVIESDAAWNSAKANDDTPHLVNGKLTDAIAIANSLGGFQGVVEARHDNESNNGGGELADTLHGKDGTHHRTSPLGCSESADRG